MSRLTEMADRVMVFSSSGSDIDEMAIVDVLTKLIFDAESDLEHTDQLVVAMLMHIDHSLGKASRRDISEFLRALAANEMITLVTAIKQQIHQQQHLIVAGQGSPGAGLRR